MHVGFLGLGAMGDPMARHLRAEARTRLLGFTDDVWIQVAPQAAGSRIAIRSASRVGFTDFGTNARRVRAYLARLAESVPGTTAGRSGR